MHNSQVFKAQLVRQVRKVMQAHRALTAPMVIRGRKVQLVPQVQMAPKDRKALRVQLVQMAHKVRKAQLERMAQLARREPLAQRTRITISRSCTT